MRCPSCGALQHGIDVVCQHCGDLLTVTTEEINRVERYRLNANTELLCVMFADVSGFSGIANRSLSLSQRILAVHMALSQAIIERDRAGEVVNTAGDGILAVFANPATATERALELHAAVHHYHQGLITSGFLAEALRAAKLALHPNIDDEEYKIHIGLHLGLVTRGGRTSRDVFGHNVNIACRFCSMAERGQTYMSEAVYDNARLILGGRDDLAWQVWKEQAVRGLAEPMTIVGVGQQPYNAILPPRGMRQPNAGRRSLFSGRLPLARIGLFAVLAAVSVTAIVLRMQPNAKEPAVTTQQIVPTPMEALPPLVATVPEPVSDAQPATPAAQPAPSDGGGPYAEGSATNAMPTGEVATPAGGDGTPDQALPVPDQAPPPADPADLDAFTVERMQSSPTITFVRNAGKRNANLLASRGQDALLLAIKLEESIGPAAEMALMIDGDCDGTLRTQSIAPFVDAALCLGTGAAGRHAFRYLAVKEGAPGAELVAANGVTGRLLTAEDQGYWLFRLPYSQLGLSGRKYAQFKLVYWPDGQEHASYAYPDPRIGLRKLEIPHEG